MGETISSVVVIDRNAERARILVEGLHEAGISSVVRIEPAGDVFSRIAAADPDVILIDLENPHRDAVEQMLRVCERVRRPVVMFADESETELLHRAVSCGVSAYIVDGLKKSRLRPIMELAVARFNRHAAMERRVAELQQQLEDRKIVEKAKGLLMRAREISEQEAHALLRRMAMNEKKKLAEIARLVIAASRLGL
ncbi:MAG: ANTAR domain-containing protein [Methyloligellaceae bacterium]